MTADICCDDRFELIEEAKRRLLESTNIEDSPEEVAVLDSMLFRFWQMGWLYQLREDKGAGTCKLVIEKRSRHGLWIYHYSCGYDFWQPSYCPMPVQKHCPNCGKRIVKEEAE